MKRHVYHQLGYDRTQDWRDAAACLDADPELFHKTKSDRAGALKREALAKAYCAKCEVRAACLADGIERDDRESIRGGLTARERQAAGMQGGTT